MHEVPSMPYDVSARTLKKTISRVQTLKECVKSEGDKVGRKKVGEEEDLKSNPNPSCYHTKEEYIQKKTKSSLGKQTTKQEMKFLF